MINTFQQRPQSRAYQSRPSTNRPITRSYDVQQSEKCFQMGKEHQRRNQMQRAQKLYLQATIHNPNSFKAFCNLGTCLKAKRDFQSAIIAYKRAKQIQPKDPITNYNLANVYRIIGNQQNAIQLYLFAISLKQKENIQLGSLYIDSYTNLGICYKNVGDQAKAIQCFEKIRSLSPQDKQAIFNQASCYLRMLRNMYKSKSSGTMLINQTHKKTVQLFEQTLKNDATNQTSVLALVQLKYLQNQSTDLLNSCVQQLTSIVAKTGNSNFMKQEASKMKAYCLSLLKKYEQSAQEYRKTLQAKKQQQDKKLAQQNKLLEQKRQKQQKKQTQERKVQQQRKKQEQNKNAKQQSDKLQIQQTQQNTTPTLQSVQSVSTIKNVKSILSLSELKPIYEQLFFKLLTSITGLIQQSQQQNLNQSEIEEKSLQIINELIQNHVSSHGQLALFKDSPSYTRLKQQLTIVMYGIIGQKLLTKAFIPKAYQIYYSYFLNSDESTPVNKELLFLETHRGVASVLTTLGFNQQAIAHYQVISEQFDKENMKDRDPLQQLHSGLGVNYQSQGLYQKAVEQFKTAISLNPSNYILHYNLGYCLYSAGKDEEAIQNYEKFLEFVQAQTNIDDQTKNSYIFQALISVFLCFSKGSLERKLQKCNKILEKFEQIYSNDLSQILKIIQSQSLMRFYLKASDILEQSIDNEVSTNGVKSDQAKIKSYKQKLFSIYISLLQLPQCPDRDQILINCGNILYEQKQYLNSLSFYQRVSQTKYEVYNNIALTLLNINEHSRAIQNIQYAIEKDPENQIYLLNYEIIKWAYNLEVDLEINLLAKLYPCDSQKEFQSRVQFAKSLITKFSNYLQLELYKEKQTGKRANLQQLNVKDFFKIILSTENTDTHWKTSQSQRKHLFLQKYIQKHCKSTQNEAHQSFETSNIKILLEIISRKDDNKEQATKAFSQLKQKLKESENRKDYFSIASQILALFVWNNFLNNKQSEHQLREIFNEDLKKCPTYQLNFKDDFVSIFQKYPSKTFSVVYPSIELKLQNIIQSFSNWQAQLEDQVGYLYRILETIAYKNSLSSLIFIEYNFPHCKNPFNCERCFKKVYNTFGQILSFQKPKTGQNIKFSTLTQAKQYLKSFISNQFGKNLEKRLQADSNNQSKILKIQLQKQTLPLEIQLCFEDFKATQKFINELCKQIEQPSLKIQQNSQHKVEIVINKLIRFRCLWKQADYLNEFVDNIVKSPLGLKNTSIDFIDADLLKTWSQNGELKASLNSVVGNQEFLW